MEFSFTVTTATIGGSYCYAIVLQVIDPDIRLLNGASFKRMKQAVLESRGT
jgi:hypothetical protein